MICNDGTVQGLGEYVLVNGLTNWHWSAEYERYEAGDK